MEQLDFQINSHRSVGKPINIIPQIENSGEYMEVPGEFEDHRLQEAANSMN